MKHRKTTLIASIKEKSFGQTKLGDRVRLFELKNEKGLEVHVINYGCTITSIRVLDKNGNPKEVAFGHDTMEGYEDRNDYFGCIAGRVANRIGNASFELDGCIYKLSSNNNGNSLHGGLIGFDKRLWDAEPFQNDNNLGVILSYVSADGEEGYPGELTCKVIYSLNSENELRIDYYANTNKKTVLNLTNHTYFNLLDGGASSILNHQLQIKASYYTPVDNKMIATGEITAVDKTPFDFRIPTPIGERIEDEHLQLINGLGYDHNFVLDKEKNALELIATVVEPTSGLTLEVLTTEPGLQLYSGNFLKGNITGKNNVTYQHRNGFCLETQHYPNSPNWSHFPSVILNPDKEFESTTVYRFK